MIARGSPRSPLPYPLAALLLVLAFGCTTSPADSEKTHSNAAGSPPRWVVNPPEADDRYFYFVGSGSSPNGVMAEAEEAARGAVLDEIMRYLGVRITSETTATARASVDSFQTDVIQQLRSSASGRVVGLEISERWQALQAKTQTLYLLARYDRVELQKEKRRLEELFQEKLEAIANPEREGKLLEDEGLFYPATLRYLEAAAAATRSDLENAEIKFERNLNQAKAALRRIGLIKLNDNLRVEIGQSFRQPFTLKVVYGAAAGDPAAEDVAIRVSYNEMRSTGRKSIRQQILKTDAGGLVRFTPPPPEFAGSEQVSMTLDLGGVLEALEGAPKKLRSQVDGLEELAFGKKALFSYVSTSAAGQVPSGIAVFDLDASGGALSMAETSAGILEILSKAGFQVQALTLVAGNIVGRTDSQVLTLLKRNFQDKIERCIYGSARISAHEQEGQSIIIQVTGTVKVVDLESGSVLLSLNRSKRAQGSNASSALAAAFKNLGQDLGQLLLSQLR